MNEYRKPRQWVLRGGDSNAPSEELIGQLRTETGLSAITLRVCAMRGLKSSEEIREFLSPRFEALTNPLTIQDIEKASERLALAREGEERIRIFGDYDVDGTTGAALLSWVLRDFGFKNFDATQPDRFKDGYGLNVKAVEEAAALGVKILVTVDCGITSFDAALKARELGIDLIIVDHHQVDPARGLPEAFAVTNPQRSDCQSGLKQLCGCGLAFYLAMALRIQGRKRGWFAAGQEPNLKQHLDLVVLATAADMVPLTGDNHVLVRHGLDVLKSTKKPGVHALLQAAGLLSKDVSPGHLGFVIGPRINASGRMQSATLALELLTTQDAARAQVLAQELEKLNTERAEIQNQIWDQVRVKVEQGIAAGRFKNGIVVADSAWHEGVVGIVASRVTETFRRPAAVIALREDFGKGSVRSFAGKDVLSALRSSSSSLLGFGGHKHAAGLTVALDKVDELAESFDRALGEMVTDAAQEPLQIEGSCELSDLSVRTLEELEKLGPFGPGNPEPVFSVRACVKDRQVIKGRHLKMHLTVPKGVTLQGARPLQLEAIWFHGAERQELLEDSFLGSEADWAGVPELNRFRGNITASLRVRDRRPTE